MNKKFIKKEIVLESLIRKYNLEQTKTYGESKGTKLSIPTITRFRDIIKKEAREYFFLLARDNDEYLLQFKTRIAAHEKLLLSHWNDFEATNNILIKLKISEQIIKIEKQLDDWYRLLPYGQGDGNNVLSNNKDSNEEEPEELPEPVL